MKTNIKGRGYLTVSILRKGKTIQVCERIPNLLLNAAFNSQGNFNQPSAQFYAHSSSAPNYEDIPGTWNQTGNIITRSTGAGTFPNSPSQLGNELLWETGQRCHVTARSSDTSITVSGSPQSFTNLRLRRFLTNISPSSGAVQSASGTLDSIVLDHVGGTMSRTARVNFVSASIGYTLASVTTSTSRIVLPVPVIVEAEDQLQMEYTFEASFVNRQRVYDLGAEAVGLPKKWLCNTIVGNGTSFDVSFNVPTNLLAGDKLDLRQIVPKRFAISSASSTSTTFTINTATAHGLITGNSVTIENASLAGYKGTFIVATGSGTVLTITNAANPGAMGAFGSVRLTTPGTYFNALFTIASMVSTSVARITSAITGPAIDPAPMGGDPGVKQIAWRGLEGNFVNGTASSLFVDFTLVQEGNKRTPPNPEDLTYFGKSGDFNADIKTFSSATYSNDFTCKAEATWNAGTGSNRDRIKQVIAQATNQNTSNFYIMLEFNTPQPKETAERMKFAFFMQCQRELTPATFP